MKTAFLGYYVPQADQYHELWKEALIVPDANVLLSIYRLPPMARDELLQVLDLLKDKIWIPYHAGLEFQRNRLSVISSQRKITEDALSSAKDLVNVISQRVDDLQLDKHGLKIEPKPLLDNLKQANDELVKAIDAVHKSQLEIASTDAIRDRLDGILMNKIGAAPLNKAEIDALIEDGEERYKEKIPPGFSDMSKEKNPNKAFFYFDGIKYESKYGDLILWRQLIKHAKSNNCKRVMFITADQKDDWWWREQGKIVGPRPELIREIHRLANVELFWMYSLSEFTEHARKYAQAEVSAQTVAELKEAQVLSSRDIDDNAAVREPLSRTSTKLIKAAVYRWLRNRFKHVDELSWVFEVNGKSCWFEIQVVPSILKINVDKLSEALERCEGIWDHGLADEVNLIVAAPKIIASSDYRFIERSIMQEMLSLSYTKAIYRKSFSAHTA